MERYAAQLHAEADEPPFVGPGLKPLALRSLRCQWRWRVKAARG